MCAVYVIEERVCVYVYVNRVNWVMCRCRDLLEWKGVKVWRLTFNPNVVICEITGSFFEFCCGSISP